MVSSDKCVAYVTEEFLKSAVKSLWKRSVEYCPLNE